MEYDNLNKKYSQQREKKFDEGSRQLNRDMRNATSGHEDLNTSRGEQSNTKSN
jgi:hypothetical protein